MAHLLNKDSLWHILEARFKDNTVVSLASLPKPDIFNNIYQAAALVKDAVDNKRKIAIVGDYDVDGVASVAILHIFFEYIGVCVQAILPNRFTDGYGLNPNIAQKLDCELLITVDNGISAIAAADICASKNIDLIIIDHHSIPEVLPKANFIIHPEFSSLTQKQISAGLVSWYFVAALKNIFNVTFDMRQILDIAAIATIADVMPLTDINRTIVRAGLEVFNTSKRFYAMAFKEFIQTNNLSTMDVAFKLAPRLNAPGRLADATLAFEFLTASSLMEAKQKLNVLDSLNEQRKQIEKDVLEEAISFVSSENMAIVVWGEHWNEGVVGIVAARLAQMYEVPAFAISVNADMAKGSARAPKGYDLFSMLRAHSDIFLKFGGHKLAAGFSLNAKDLPELKTRMQNAAIRLENVAPFELGELDPESINLDLLELVDKFEPYGEGNPRPIFLAKNARIINVTQVGKMTKYTKIAIVLNKTQFEILYKEDTPSFRVNESLTFAYSLGKNEFNRQVSVRMRLEKLYAPKDS